MLDGCGFDEERLLARLRGRERSYAAVLDELLTDCAERHGARRWSEKTLPQRLDGRRRMASAAGFARPWLRQVGQPPGPGRIGRGRAVLSAAEQAEIAAAVAEARAAPAGPAPVVRR